MLRVTLALSIALVLAAAASAEPIREDRYVEKNLISDNEVQDLELIVEPEQEDEDALSNRAKRSPVFPGYDVVQWKIIPKGLKKKAKKKFKKVIKVSPFVALKAVKKTPFILKKGLKFVPPAALLGGALGGSLGGIGPGLAGAAGAIGLPALLSAGGGGGAAAVPTLVSSAMGLFGPAIGLAG